jgi:4,5-dihydroxyphthalate decarboxylase
MTLASWPYDRVEALRYGIVSPKRINLKFVASHPGDTFLKMLGHQEFEASELSMSSYIMTKELHKNGKGPFIAIPVFTSRTFRHNGLFINTDSGIKEPRDLIGKKVGLPEYQITAALWIRGILQHEYDVNQTQIKWYAERWGRGMHSHGSAVGFKPPAGVSLYSIPKEESQFTLLKKGKLDAAFIIQELPSSICRSSLSDFRDAPTNIRRLFVDYKKVESDYYLKTGLFPIMHTVAIRRDIYEKYPWTAMSLFNAFCESKELFYKKIAEWELFSFPWIREALDEQRKIMGEDPYPYGLRANKKVVDTICQYSNEQGLSQTNWKAEDLFAGETLTT